MPGNMCFQFNVAYGSDPLQKLDVYMPAGGGRYKGARDPDGPRRRLVPGRQDGHPGGAEQSAELGAPGTVFISINYPLVPKVNALQEAQSVALALGCAAAARHRMGRGPGTSSC